MARFNVKGFCNDCKKIKRVTSDHWCEKCFEKLKIKAEGILSEYLRNYEDTNEGEPDLETPLHYIELEMCKSGTEVIDFMKDFEIDE